MAYKITAEIKKGWQSWGMITLHRDSKLTKKALIKQMEIIKTPFGKSRTDVQVRNFVCEGLIND